MVMAERGRRAGKGSEPATDALDVDHRRRPQRVVDGDEVQRPAARVECRARADAARRRGAARVDRLAPKGADFARDRRRRQSKRPRRTSTTPHQGRSTRCLRSPNRCRACASCTSTPPRTAVAWPRSFAPRSHCCAILGLDANWSIIGGDDEFFAVTKALHNGLQGAERTLDEHERAEYLAHTATNAALLDDDYDVIVVHDPQPLAIPATRGRGGAKWLWRCHIDTSAPNPQTWAFLRPFISAYDSAVFTLGNFVPTDFPLDRVAIVPPAIDSQSPKNIDLPRQLATRVLDWIGVEVDRPLIVQISRFDPWKDPLGVIAAYQLVKQDVPDAQLVLAGSMARFGTARGSTYSFCSTDLRVEFRRGPAARSSVPNDEGTGDWPGDVCLWSSRARRPILCKREIARERCANLFVPLLHRVPRGSPAVLSRACKAAGHIGTPGKGCTQSLSKRWSTWPRRTRPSVTQTRDGHALHVHDEACACDYRPLWGVASLRASRRRVEAMTGRLPRRGTLARHMVPPPSHYNSPFHELSRDAVAYSKGVPRRGRARRRDSPGPRPQPLPRGRDARPEEVRQQLLRVRRRDQAIRPVAALDACSFTARPGRLTGFLGPNGAGKTTAMRAVFGLVELDAGAVRWRGGADRAGAARAVRLHARGARPLPAHAGPRPARVPRPAVRPEQHEVSRTVDAWLERLGLADRGSDRLDALSHGNQQRVQLIAALVNEPELLVLDEPFSGLDPLAHRRHVRAARRGRRRGHHGAVLEPPARPRRGHLRGRRHHQRAAGSSAPVTSPSCGPRSHNDS